MLISWMGFVVPLEQTAARIALGITSLLTEVTILNMMNNSMPKVSNINVRIQCILSSWFTSSDLQTLKYGYQVQYVSQMISYAL